MGIDLRDFGATSVPEMLIKLRMEQRSNRKEVKNIICCHFWLRLHIMM